MKAMPRIIISLCIILFICSFCKKADSGNNPNPPADTTSKDTVYTVDKFCMGADLSYVNQILDHSGVYKDSNEVRDPYRIFKEHGANLVRVRLWHTPDWTKTVYTPAGTQMYNDLADAEKTIKKAKDLGMAVNLDFHYSDTWADPAKQNPPKAWVDIKDTATLRDSVYNYTFKVLSYLNSKGLMPEMVQIGNEINQGMLSTNLPTGFPNVNVYSPNNKWKEQGVMLNAGIRAVRAVAASSAIKSKIILHVADPKNVDWWFTNIISNGKVTDFDVVGFSYYPLWHTTVSFDNLGAQITNFKTKFNRKVMILETAYPWTTSGVDSYSNQFGSETPLTGYPFTMEGQYNFMVALTQKVISAGGSGVMYWEPAWITSQMKDLWGTGSSWENVTFFDFNGNTQKGINFMNYKYSFPAN
jgi:arabinogalactan endo-1,4-beta-galactosidase